MTKGVILTAFALALATNLPAQTERPDSIAQQDDADFTFTEAQLDDDNDALQTVSVMSSKSNPYLSNVGYLWSPMRFRLRGYDNQYNQVYMNGLLFNDAESGRFNFSSVGGLNDATRSKESVGAFEYNNFGLVGVGGAQNTNLRASAFGAGHKLTLSACNRNYVGRFMYTAATGLTDKGWALAASVGYRGATRGVIEGTFYNSGSYFLSAEKRFADRHALTIATWGTPTERGQQTAATEEAYWLANSHYYNPNWGYQNGKRRNSRTVKSFEPTAMATWDFNISEKMKLTTSGAFRYSMYSSTALGWNGNAADPRPDYYKNLPSSIFNVYDELNYNNPDYLSTDMGIAYLGQYNDLVEFWTSSKANRQVNWDRMYYVNRENEAAGGDALYYLERRHNDQRVFALSSTLSHNFNAFNKYAAGLQLSTTKGMHYKTMDDLLGGTRYVDVDKFAAKDYGPYSPEAQNDLDNPNRSISEGDKFGYDYNIFVNKAKLWTAYQYAGNMFSIAVGGHLDATTMEREGLMRNGRAAENSLGKSGRADFFGGGAKAIWSIRPAANHRIQLSGSAEMTPPQARNAFVAPRIQNNFVDNLKVEKILGAELTYNFRAGNLTGYLAGYYTHFANQVEQTAFYNDSENRFTYLTMSGIRKVHYGLEAAFNYQITSNFSVNLTGTLSEAKYINNPYAQLAYEGTLASMLEQLNTWQTPLGNAPLRVMADGMRVNGTPLTAVSLGLNYNVNSWFFSANLNYYDRVYVGFSQYRRLSNLNNYTYTDTPEVGADGQIRYNREYIPYNSKAVNDKNRTGAYLAENGGIVYGEDGKIAEVYQPKQEKFDGGFMLDASIGRYIRFRNGQSLSVNLQLQNLTNNTNMRTGGYEQNRDDSYTSGEERMYKFSKNAKYYYANAFNFFLNLGYRF